MDLLATLEGQTYKETELLPDFLTDIFVRVLGYTTPVAQIKDERYTLSREKLVEEDGKFADAVLGDFRSGQERFVVAVEGKGPRDPLERPHAGRKMSAVDQGYRYAINLVCDWIVVTNLREVRFYYKGATQLLEGPAGRRDRGPARSASTTRARPSAPTSASCSRRSPRASRS